MKAKAIKKEKQLFETKTPNMCESESYKELMKLNKEALRLLRER